MLNSETTRTWAPGNPLARFYQNLACCCLDLQSTTPFAEYYMCIIPEKLPDYSRIMLYAFADRLFRKLCRHIRRISTMQLYGGRYFRLVCIQHAAREVGRHTPPFPSGKCCGIRCSEMTSKAYHILVPKRPLEYFSSQQLQICSTRQEHASQAKCHFMSFGGPKFVSYIHSGYTEVH